MQIKTILGLLMSSFVTFAVAPAWANSYSEWFIIDEVHSGNSCEECVTIWGRQLSDDESAEITEGACTYTTKFLLVPKSHPNDNDESLNYNVSMKLIYSAFLTGKPVKVYADQCVSGYPMIEAFFVCNKSDTSECDTY